MTCTIDGKEYNLEVIKRETRDFMGGDIVTTTYKCPLCGEGTARRIDENTPGDRDHSFYIDCENCNPGHNVFERADCDCMNLKTRTALEVGGMPNG